MQDKFLEDENEYIGLYKSLRLYLPVNREKIREFADNYSKDILVKWNEDICKSYIEEINEVLQKNIKFELFVKLNHLFNDMFRVFHYNRNIYIEELDCLKKYCNKYGYSAFYSQSQKRTAGRDWVCGIGTNIYMFYYGWTEAKMDTFLSEFYNGNYNKFGLVSYLYYTNNIDLIKQFIIDVYNPARKIFFEHDELMDKYDLVHSWIFWFYYHSDLIMDIDDIECNKELNNFLKEINLFDFVVEVKHKKTKYSPREKYIIYAFNDVNMDKQEDYFYPLTNQDFLSCNAYVAKLYIKRLNLIIGESYYEELYKTILYNFNQLLPIYHKEREVYVETLQVLKKFCSFYKNCGFLYEMNDHAKDYGYEIDQYLFCLITTNFKGPGCLLSKTEFSLEIDDKHEYGGFLHSLYCSGNIDLIKEFIIDIYNPAREKFFENNELYYKFEDYGLEIPDRNKIKSIDDVSMCKILNRFFEKIGLIDLVKKID